MVRALILISLTACSAPLDSEPCEGPVFDAVAIPEGCRHDPRCVGSEAQDACGSTYLCIVDGHQTCVTATDCDCMAAWSDECPGSAEVPAFCDYREQER